MRQQVGFRPLFDSCHYPDLELSGLWWRSCFSERLSAFCTAQGCFSAFFGQICRFL